MTRVFLAAGVAALAIAAPATAGPRGDRGGGNNRPAQVQRGGGGPRAQAVQRGGGGFAAPPMQRQQAAPRMERQQQRVAIERPQQRMQMRAERQQARPQRMQAPARVAEHQQMRVNRQQGQARVAERQQMRAGQQQAQARMAERQQMRVNRQQGQARMAQRQQIQANRQQVQNRMAQRQQMQANRANQVQNRMAQRQQMQANRANQVQNRMAQRQQLQANRVNQAQNRMAMRQQMQDNRQGARNLLADRRALRQDRIANVDAFRTSRLANLALSRGSNVRVVDPVQAVRFVGQPVSSVTNYVTLAALPGSVSYLYPDTPNYYYQYGGGYLYQVDRSTSLIDALIPLLAGGFMPGTYLPQPYMASYVPSYYGLDSFYPASYDDGYGYGNVCNRYADGMVYQVDCNTGMVEDVVPLYAGGYGVGQMLPSAYSYYNVPMQYRSMYYPTSNSSYWYGPGAIYQYDTSSSLITSVAALLSPGFSIGQPLPAGYDVYNVPYAYRGTYYDTPTASYRYNDGYIYQVDPRTQLVTAMVASLLA